jgi:hypothetical protein
VFLLPVAFYSTTERKCLPLIGIPGNKDFFELDVLPDLVLVLNLPEVLVFFFESDGVEEVHAILVHQMRNGQLVGLAFLEECPNDSIGFLQKIGILPWRSNWRR